jgi:hypothetical protein
LPINIFCRLLPEVNEIYLVAIPELTASDGLLGALGCKNPRIVLVAHRTQLNKCFDLLFRNIVVHILNIIPLYCQFHVTSIIVVPIDTIKDLKLWHNVPVGGHVYQRNLGRIISLC